MSRAVITRIISVLVVLVRILNEFLVLLGFLTLPTAARPGTVNHRSRHGYHSASPSFQGFTS